MKAIVKMFFFAVFLIIFAVSCAHNSVSVMEWWSRATLIDGAGNISEGKAIFHFSYRDGTIEIPHSKYGHLSGRFVTQTQSISNTRAGIGVASTGEEKIVVPTIASQKLQSGSSHGMAYLQTDGRVILKCNIAVDFKTRGLGDAQMVGSGICADESGEQSQLIFGR
jgi:hypothetical protein